MFTMKMMMMRGANYHEMIKETEKRKKALPNNDKNLCLLIFIYYFNKPFVSMECGELSFS